MDFNRVVLSWKGEPYVIEKGNVLEAIARVEDVLTIADLAEAQRRGKFPAAKLSMAYGQALRFAGAEVTDKDVYFGMFNGNGEGSASIMAAVSGLLAMMVPVGMIDAGPSPGNVEADAAASASDSSANASSRSSGKSTSRRKRSGK